MIRIGQLNTLTVVRDTEVGLYLSDGGKEEALLPISHVKNKYSVGNKLDVFVYPDAEKRLIASESKPYAEIDTFSYLRVTDVAEFGAFMDWGLEKDLFIPLSEQKVKMQADEFYVVYIYQDKVTGRMVGSSRWDKFISTDIQLEVAQEVDLLVIEESDLGFTCIINGKYKGLMYHSDIYKDVFIGDEMKGYVKNIREDKLIDISFQKSGFKNVLDSTDVVIEYLEKNNGFMNLHDKSSPEEISIRLSMSKATFKKAIGILYRHRRVLIKPDGVYLVKKEEQTNTINP